MSDPNAHTPAADLPPTPETPVDCGQTLASGVTVTFNQHIVPLFRPMDVQCMRNPQFGPNLDRPVLLLNYAWMSDSAGNDTYPDHANAHNVYDHLTGAVPPQMPDGGPYWSQACQDLFKKWMDDGYLQGTT
jgi:hypothetical protein